MPEPRSPCWRQRRSAYGAGTAASRAGIFRCAHGGLDDLLPIVTDDAKEWAPRVSLEAYPPEQFLGDLVFTAQGQSDDELIRTVVDRSYETVTWMRDKGVHWELVVDKLHDPEKLGPDEIIVIPPGGRTASGPRRSRARARPLRGGRGRGYRDRARRPGRSSAHGGPTVRGRQGPPSRRLRRVPRPGRAGLWRLRVEPREAAALSRYRLGPREGTWNGVQHGRDARRGDGRGGCAGWPLERLPRLSARRRRTAGR